MKYEAPDDLSAASLVELREVARWARELDIAVQVEMASRSETRERARQEARFAAMNPTARATVRLLEGYGYGKRGKWTMLWIAAGIAVLLNAQQCVTVARDFVTRVQSEKESLQPPPVEVRQ